MKRRGVSAIDLVDVFVYLVVLGAFVQLAPAVISESFLASLVTAILLKLVLELVVRVKTAIVGRIRVADTRASRRSPVQACWSWPRGAKR